MLIPIYRDGLQVSSFKADESTVYTYQLMGEHKIVANFQVVDPLPIQIGDYITFKGQNFYLNTVPSIKADHLLEYSVVFESLIYRLNDKILLDEGNMNFTYYGDAQNYLELIVVNMNEIDPGWSVGTVDQTVDKHIQFEGRVNCLTALGQISKEFSLEYYLTGKAINLVKQAGTSTAHVFRYGRQKGLYGLSRNYVDNKNIVTKVYGFGSDKNLPVGYRSGATQLIFNEKFLTQNTELYGIKEGVYEDNEVFPQRTGTVQSASTSLDTGIYTITDSTIDFNINDYLLPGVTAKIIFKTGELAGYEFEITGYNNTTKVITYKSFTDSANYVLPNETFSAQVGDTYTLIDIAMPASYITAAELELKNRTTEYLAENSVPRVSYALELDPLHAKTNNIDLVPGDKVTIIDTRLGVNTLIRVNSISYPITFPEHLVKDRTFINAEIADFVSYTIQEKIKADVRDAKKEIKVIDRTNAEAARRNTARLRELQGLVFDPDGYFDPENIKPKSIETYMLTVGAKSQNFNLSGVVLTPNQNNNPNLFQISSGNLIHREVQIDGGGYVWNLPQATFSGLDPNKPYYVYARCFRSLLNGNWFISDTQIQTESDPEYYYFSVGILYRVLNGYRDFDFTNGITSIVGDNIKTGRISSIDGGTYIDLNGGQSRIRGQMIFSNGVDAEALINDSFEESIEYVNAIRDNLQNQLDGVIESYFDDYEPTLANYPASSWTTIELKNEHLGDTFTNDSTGLSYRWTLESGNYFWKQIADTDALLALQKAQEAQDTADGKRRTFLNQPVGPYDRGDMWMTGSDILVATTDRPSGSYIAGDWVKLDKYTDDTAVNNLQIGGRNLLIDSSFEGGVLQPVDYHACVPTIGLKEDIAPVFGSKYLILDSEPNGGDVYSYFNKIVPVIAGKAYSLSFYLASDNLSGILGGSSYIEWITASGVQYEFIDHQSTSLSREFKRFGIYLTAPSNATAARLRFGIILPDYGWLLVDNIKFESGNKATDWTPAPEDVEADATSKATAAKQAAIDAAKTYADAQIQQTDILTRAYADGIVTDAEALAIAEAAEALRLAKEDATAKAGAVDAKIGNLPTGMTIIEGGKINTDLLVADTVIAKQVVTSGTNNITLNQNEDNQLKFRHTNDQVGIQIGIIDGELKLVFYNENGLKVWEGGQSGIVYVESVPESWTVEYYYQMSTSIGESQTTENITALKNILKLNTCSIGQVGDIGIASNTTGYRYNAGLNGGSEANKVYNGLHTAQVRATNNFVANGWYVQAGYGFVFENPEGTLYSASIVYLTDGRVTTSLTLTSIPYQYNSTCNF